MQLHKTYSFMQLIWEKENPDWNYIRRRLHDLYFFMYWAEAENEQIAADLLFLTNIAAIREYMG